MYHYDAFRIEGVTKQEKLDDIVAMETAKESDTCSLLDNKDFLTWQNPREAVQAMMMISYFLNSSLSLGLQGWNGNVLNTHVWIPHQITK